MRRYSLASLLLAVAVIACGLRVWIWFGNQVTLMVIAVTSTGYAVRRRGFRAFMCASGLAWLSALVMLFSGFYTNAYGPMGGEMARFAQLNWLTTATPVQMSMIWLGTFSLISFGLLSGITAFLHIMFGIPLFWKFLASLLFLVTNGAISSVALILWWSNVNAPRNSMIFCFATSVAGAVIAIFLRRIRVTESRQVAVADAMSVISVLPLHVPWYAFIGGAKAMPLGPGNWMLLAGTTGLLAASVWLWLNGDYHKPS